MRGWRKSLSKISPTNFVLSALLAALVLPKAIRLASKLGSNASKAAPLAGPGYFVVPHNVTSSTATVWVAALDQDVRAQRIRLICTAAPVPGTISPDGPVGRWEQELDMSQWQTWKSQRPLDWKDAPKGSKLQTLHHQRVTLGLERRLLPRTRYDLQLVVDGQDTYAKASVTTLPSRLPGPGEKPFTVLLGSCFYYQNDEEHGWVGKTFSHIAAEDKPELKFFCGDQVYLDNPWKNLTYFITRPFQAPSLLRSIFLHRYLDNWTHAPTSDSGFKRLLSEGANYFISDDHEYWNNAPDLGGVGLINTLIRPQREWWFREAAELFRIFQSVSPLQFVEVPPLSICVADTRINRHGGRRQFMDPEDLNAVCRWIKGLAGPGVLVVGQPLLAKRANLWTADRFELGLPDYTVQYQQLVDAIKASEHSIILFTGDVHFGRVAECELNAKTGTKFVEMISSPLSVVTDGLGRAKLSPYQNPSEVVPSPVFKVERARPTGEKNHFLTIEFAARLGAGTGSSMHIKAKFWPIADNADRTANSVSSVVYNAVLH